MPIRKIHNDEPTFDFKDEMDIFGQKNFVEEIAKTMALNSTPPFVAGLAGDWGQGKTSLLQAIFKMLTGHMPGEKIDHKSEYENVRVIWFEAWRYQHDSAPIVALLNEIRCQLDMMAKCKKSGKKLLGVAFESALLSLGDLGGRILPFASLPGKIKETGENWEKRNHAYALPSQSIRALLNEAISQSLKGLITPPKTRSSISPRLVIIIDDLDRCQPLVAYKLLEGIKIFLNLESCNFLLGINRKEIERSIAAGLSEEAGDPFKTPDDLEEGGARNEVRIRAQEYFEKLCSCFWDIPFPDQDQSAEYVKHLLTTSNIVSQKFAETIHTILQDKKFNHSLLPANPRKLKSFANQVATLAQKYKPNNTHNFTPDDEQSKLFIILAALTTFHPIIYRMLLANPRFYAEILDWAKNPDKDKSFESARYDIAKILYEEPSDVNVMRIIPLIVELGNVTADTIKPFLRHGI